MLVYVPRVPRVSYDNSIAHHHMVDGLQATTLILRRLEYRAVLSMQGLGYLEIHGLELTRNLLTSKLNNVNPLLRIYMNWQEASNSLVFWEDNSVQRISGNPVNLHV